MRLLAAVWARVIGYYGFGDRAGMRRREPVQIGYGGNRRRA